MSTKYEIKKNINDKYKQMLVDFEKVQVWNESLISEDEMFNESDFWYCCVRLRQSLDELINAKNK